MNRSELDKILLKAQEICSQTGSRLTEKRKKILEVLIESKKPLSAYDIADKYNKSADATMPAMSVYRILEFLESEQLVHKLASANKYVACSHIACSHSHEVPQFLICSICQAVKEISIKRSIINELGQQVENAGYKLNNSQLELDCVCDKCREAV